MQSFHQPDMLVLGKVLWCATPRCTHTTQRTWGCPWFIVAQLSTAVGPTGVHAPIMQQEYWMLSSTDCFFQAPATEHITVSGLKHRIPLHFNAQLPIFCFPPTQHVEKGEVMSTKSKRQQGSNTQMEEDKGSSGLTAAPFSPLNVTSKPGRMRNQSERKYCAITLYFQHAFV